jgi:hypothetical protein
MPSTVLKFSGATMPASQEPIVILSGREAEYWHDISPAPVRSAECRLKLQKAVLDMISASAEESGAVTWTAMIPVILSGRRG